MLEPVLRLFGENLAYGKFLSLIHEEGQRQMNSSKIVKLSGGGTEGLVPEGWAESGSSRTPEPQAEAARGMCVSLWVLSPLSDSRALSGHGLCFSYEKTHIFIPMPILA